jgi:hypothetical protein
MNQGELKMAKFRVRTSKRVFAEDQSVSVDAVKDLLHDLVDALEVDEEGFTLDLDSFPSLDGDIDADGDMDDEFGHEEPDGDEFGGEGDDDGDEFEAEFEDEESDEEFEDEFEKMSSKVTQAKALVAHLDAMATEVQQRAAAAKKKNPKRAGRLMKIAARIDSVSNEIEARIKGGLN